MARLERIRGRSGAEKRARPVQGSGARRRGRELALGILFEADLGGGPAMAFENAGHTLQVLSEEWGLTPEERARLLPEIEDFGRRLADLYFQHAGQIDELLAQYAYEWALPRMATVDRNLLRLALTEICYFPDTPVSVAIDEAVELAKEYSGPEAAKFINGILGAYARAQGLATDAAPQQERQE